MFFFLSVSYNLIEGDGMDNNKMIEFKNFVKNNSFLITYIRNGKKSWQDFYEMYDLYVEDEDAWEKYLEEDQSSTSANSRSNSGGYWDEFMKVAKNIDMDKVQEGISSLQKTLGLFGDLFVNKNGTSTKEYNPRPLYRRFED